MSEAWKLSRSCLVCLWQCLLCGTICSTCTFCFKDFGTKAICPFCSGILLFLLIVFVSLPEATLLHPMFLPCWYILVQVKKTPYLVSNISYHIDISQNRSIYFSIVSDTAMNLSIGIKVNSSNRKRTSIFLICQIKTSSVVTICSKLADSRC